MVYRFEALDPVQRQGLYTYEKLYKYGQSMTMIFYGA